MHRSVLPALMVALAACVFAVAPVRSQENIERDFKSPPHDARPMTWWHWMNGNITKEGITADLEAMKRIGLGGAEIFNVEQGEPAGPVKFMSPEWRALTKHAIAEANRLGLTLAIHNCAGWSESGGPWVTPDQSMQKVVWSETVVFRQSTQSEVRDLTLTLQPDHVSQFSGTLPQPQTVRGVYHDIAALAFPTIRGVVTKQGIPIGTRLLPDIEAKIGMVPNPRLTFTEGRWPDGETIHQDRIVDLTDRLKPDGRLDWDVPAGTWTILRFGHTSTGQQNAPAPESGRGLECDKMSRAAVEAHFEGMMAKVIADAGPLAGQSLKFALADSWEAGTQNWTPAFPQEFRNRTGYELRKWLPVLTGRVVNGLDQSERFLWDFRRVIADLIAENHYSVLRELCARHGMQLTAEAPGIGMPTIADEIQCKGRTDMPMGEFWLDGHNDSKEAATSAHVYGKRRASAEAFTAVTRDARWMKAPFDHKAIGDLNFCRGINLFVFHRYAMQPWLVRAPGMTMGPWGTNFERTNTWWEQARAWMQYLSRCQALLQDGRFVADACYYYGEGAPNTIESERSALKPPLPAGYDFDVCDTETLLTRMKVINGRIVLPDGMSYRVLVLPDSQRMSLRVLHKIRLLVMAGATVVGPRPVSAPSLSFYPAGDEEIDRVASHLWYVFPEREMTPHLGMKGPERPIAKPVFERRVGRGRVIWDRPVGRILAELGAPPDVTGPSDDRLVWIHRRAGDADVYFVSNQDPFAATARVTFRAGNRRPELWEPDTGRMVETAQYTAANGMVTVPLHFDPAGSVFVVFRHPAAAVDPIVKAQRNGRNIIVDAPLAPSGHLVIERAVYGVDPARNVQSVDVTRPVAAAVRGGRLRIEATNDLAGDPAVNTVKKLTVVYRLNGVRSEATVDENKSLILPVRADIHPTGPPSPPAPEITFNGRGGYLIRAAEPGTYTLQTAAGRMLSAVVHDLPAPARVSGSWRLRFPPHWGAPEQVTMDRLVSWTASPDDGVQHFSGTAMYWKEIQIPAARLEAGRSLWLDLGTVKEVAEVFLNGKELGILWKPPFRVNLSRAARAGANQLEVRITNLWPNRLIGDAALPPEKRLTYATFQPFKPGDPLLESGLLGPVTLQSSETVTPH